MVKNADFCCFFAQKGLPMRRILFFVCKPKESEKILMSTPLDTKVIGKLAEILDKNNLTEIEYEDEGCRISLSRTVHGAPVPPPAPMPVPAAAPAPVPAAPATPAPAPAAVEDYSNSPNAIKSPMVGVVYLSADPNSPNYVKVGDSVKEGDIVCLIEAMKTFNPVKSHKSGTVAKILVEGGDPVEYGEPLVIVE